MCCLSCNSKAEVLRICLSRPSSLLFSSSFVDAWLAVIGLTCFYTYSALCLIKNCKGQSLSQSFYPTAVLLIVLSNCHEEESFCDITDFEAQPVIKH